MVHGVLEALDADGKRNGMDLEVLGVVLVLHGEVYGMLEALDAGVNHLRGQPLERLFDVHPCLEVEPKCVSSANGYNHLGAGDLRRRASIAGDRKGMMRSRAGAANVMRTVVQMSHLWEDTTDAHLISIQRSRLSMGRHTIINNIFYK
jgi:hypothetical protein